MKLLLTILSLLFLNPIIAQREQLMLIPFEKDGQWGYVNYDKKVIVAPQFDEAYPTYHLLGRFKKNGKYGYVDTKGDIVVKPKLDDAEDLKYGIAQVAKGRKSYYINSTGKRNKIFYSHCGNGSPYFDINDNKSIDKYIFKEDNKYGIKYEITYRKNGELVRILDSIPAVYDTIIPLTSQFWVIKKEEKYALLTYYGMYESQEAFLGKIELKHTEIKLFQNPNNNHEIHNIIGFKSGEYWGYGKIDISYREITLPKYLSIGPMFNNYGLVEYEKGKFGYIDSRGREYFDAASLEDE